MLHRPTAPHPLNLGCSDVLRTLAFARVGIEVTTTRLRDNQPPALVELMKFGWVLQANQMRAACASVGMAWSEVPGRIPEPTQIARVLYETLMVRGDEAADPKDTRLKYFQENGDRCFGPIATASLEVDYGGKVRRTIIHHPSSSPPPPPPPSSSSSSSHNITSLITRHHPSSSPIVPNHHSPSLIIIPHHSLSLAVF